MLELLQQIKGLHPGVYLERELKKRSIAKGKFALSIQEYPQTLVSVMKGKRRMNPGLAIRAERSLGLEDGFLMMMQALHDMKEEQSRHLKGGTPNLSRFRPVLFWDTDFNKLNWELNRKAIIRRVEERGNKMERDEIRNFYGEDVVNKIAHSSR